MCHVSTHLRGGLVSCTHMGGALASTHLRGALVSTHLRGALVSSHLRGALVSTHLRGALVSSHSRGALSVHIWEEPLSAHIREEPLSGQIVEFTDRSQINSQPLNQSEFRIKLTPQATSFRYDISVTHARTYRAPLCLLRAALLLRVQNRQVFPSDIFARIPLLQ